MSQSIIRECRTVLQRIRLGIDTVCDEKNPDATLAFCFANKAINLQYGWANGGDDLIYRPFQLAYVLMCIESIVNKESSYRDVCDLMWVPTGTGKPRRIWPLPYLQWHTAEDSRLVAMVSRRVQEFLS